MPEPARIAVIGGGVLGAAIAWRLAGTGARVAVIDSGEPGESASHGSLAWLNVASARDPDYARFRARSLRLWQRLAAEAGAPARFDGSFLAGGQRGDPAARAAWLAELGWPARALTGRQFAARQPQLAAAPESVLHVPGEGVVEPRRAVAWFRRQAEAGGAEWIRGRAVAIDRGVHIAEGRRIAADMVVASAGTGTRALVAPLGAELAIERRPGLLVRTGPAPPLARGYVELPAVQFWQTEESVLLAGPGDGAGGPEEIVAALARLYHRPAPLAAAEILRRDRPVPADGLPVIGFLPSAPEVYVAVSHSGMTLAPLLGRLVAREVTTGRPAPELADYRPR